MLTGCGVGVVVGRVAAAVGRRHTLMSVLRMSTATTNTTATEQQRQEGEGVEGGVGRRSSSAASVVRRRLNRGGLQPYESAVESGRAPDHNHFRYFMPAINQENPNRNRFSTDAQLLKVRRRMLGTFGTGSGVDPSLAWPSRRQLADDRRLESFSVPDSIDAMLSHEHNVDQQLDNERQQIKRKVLLNLSKQEDWMRQLATKKQQKMNEITAFQAKREQQIEEIRSHFGYKVDPKEEKFQKMMEQKELEQKKADKERKKQERQAKMIAKLMRTDQHQTTTATATTVTAATAADDEQSKQQSNQQPQQGAESKTT